LGFTSGGACRLAKPSQNERSPIRIFEAMLKEERIIAEDEFVMHVMEVDSFKDTIKKLVDHGSEINLMSMDFYKKGKWPINTKHGWKIRATTGATEELHGACPNVRVKIGDVEIDQHFFVQETSSHPVILGEPYITTARMETKVLDNGSAYARIRSQDGHHSVQFLTVHPNHERNRETLGGECREDF
jgi:hypothetical protein